MTVSSVHRLIRLSFTPPNTNAFTLIELLTTIALTALLVAIIIPTVANYVSTARQTADQQTLQVLNDAINRYKMQGGNVSALTAGKPYASLISALKTPVSWNGITHQFLRNSGSYEQATTIAATGSGKNYRLTRINTYRSDTPAFFSSNFDGSEAPLSEGGRWTNPALSSLRKNSGVVTVNNTSESCARLSSPVFAANQYSQITLVSVNSSGSMSPAVRIDTSARGYYLYIYSNKIELWKYNPGWQQVGSGIAHIANSGDIVRLEAEGTTFRAKFNGTTIRTWTDSSYTSGQPGMSSYANASASADNFEAGDL